MTTHQLIAMVFPLFTAAAVALVALFIRRPWAEDVAEARTTVRATAAKRDGTKRDVVLDQLERLNAEIEGNAHLARQQLESLRKSRPS